MVSYALLCVRHVLFPGGDHAEVRRGLGLSCVETNRTPRIYAVTGNNRLIAGCLSFLSSVQFAFGIYLSIRFALRGRGSLLPFLESTF